MYLIPKTTGFAISARSEEDKVPLTKDIPCDKCKHQEFDETHFGDEWIRSANPLPKECNLINCPMLRETESFLSALGNNSADHVGQDYTATREVVDGKNKVDIWTAKPEIAKKIREFVANINVKQ